MYPTKFLCYRGVDLSKCQKANCNVSSRQLKPVSTSGSLTPGVSPHFPSLYPFSVVYLSYILTCAFHSCQTWSRLAAVELECQPEQEMGEKAVERRISLTSCHISSGVHRRITPHIEWIFIKWVDRGGPRGSRNCVFRYTGQNNFESKWDIYPRSVF